MAGTYDYAVALSHENNETKNICTQEVDGNGFIYFNVKYLITI
jgi:hypothetical protein